MPKIATKNAPSKPRQRKANGYKFPEKLPEGLVLKDVAKKEWVLGTSIGQGGFGEIYSASASGASSANNPFVIKIEPHENGPLFVEKNFYIKIARPDDVDNWKNEKGIKVLGIPAFYGSGSQNYKSEKYRFIVIERYGNNLWDLFLKNKRKFPSGAVYKCAVQIIDVLHYIHDKGYVHGDIKGANLLLGIKKGTENNVFLVDFGLACKYNNKEFQRDPKKAHNGTIEYTSRDWHLGVPTRRGDLEILGFNLLHWLGSTLPWEKDIKNPEKVFEKKRDLMENVKDYMKKHYPLVPKVIGDYLHYVANLKHDETPDYDYCKELFIKELKGLPGSTNGKLDFTKDVEPVPISKTPKKTPVKPVPISKTPKKTPVEPVPISKTPKKTPASKRKSSTKYDEKPLDSDSDNDIFVTPSPKRSLRISRNTPNTPVIEKSVEKTVPKPRSKKENVPKPSWRDAPSAQASNIAKAGEYVKKDKPIRKRTNK